MFQLLTRSGCSRWQGRHYLCTGNYRIRASGGIGVSFALLGVSIILPIIVIGSITFLLSFFGFVAGSKFGRLLGRKVEIAGGIVLISIGITGLHETLNPHK
ncbi:hypothetical protein CEE34_06535 [Candidatus Aerophobetes bacterium Ae_b3a]|nr:MAG: hypothetical protein CEE34_06535 [Candidatus Aerophobetes bacterium Ae_b3a]